MSAAPSTPTRRVSIAALVAHFTLVLVALAIWLVGAFYFVLYAWGARGMPKPWWIGLAAVAANFGWVVPIGLLAWAIVQLVRRLRQPRGVANGDPTKLDAEQRPASSP
jgi:endonuclease/exonuclease/phosphatase (EEP) superfamily protein YafD